MSKDSGADEVANLPGNRSIPSAMVVEDLLTAHALLTANFEALGAILDSFDRYINMLKAGDLYPDTPARDDVQIEMFPEEGG